MAGCSVLTRPSMISGNPVTSDTSVTAMPAARSASAVPPVDTITTPWRTRPAAKSTIPVLSETESRARLIGRFGFMSVQSASFQRQFRHRLVACRLGPGLPGELLERPVDRADPSCPSGQHDLHRPPRHPAAVEVDTLLEGDGGVPGNERPAGLVRQQQEDR